MTGKNSMESTESYDIMFKDWQKLISSTPPTLKDEICKEQIPILKNVKTGIDSSALTILDIESNKYLYVEESIENITGCKRELYFKKGPKYIFTRATFKQMPNIISSTIHQRIFFSKLPKLKFDNYIINREMSYRKSGQPDKWVLLQQIKHLTNSVGKIFAVANLQTDIGNIKMDDKFRYYIFSKTQNKIIYEQNNANVLKHSVDVLSVREKKVLKLLKFGYSNKQIADLLCISYHTVRTHRKNIFNKLSCNNLIDVLNLVYYKD